jgi:alkylation response protein AidB-like acyl-CoA dehydrogenase
VMELAFSEEQQELAATVRSLLTKRADSPAVRAAMVSDTGYDEELWQTLCDQIGVAALAIPEEYDGAGFTLLESMVVLEEVGRSLAPSPLLSSLVAAEAVLAGADDETRKRLLPRIAAGEVAAYAVAGEPSLFADQATVLVAVVGEDLVELPDGAAAWLPSMDQTTRLASVDLDGGTRIGDGAVARARADLVGAVGVAALSTGLAARALEMTVAYSQERVQFGRPIGSFQALKHRMADLHVLVEMSRSASWAASYALSTDAANAPELAHVAKSYCSEALSRIAAETVQLHGGIAITWEHDAQLVFKRAHALRQLFGTPQWHRALIEL